MADGLRYCPPLDVWVGDGFLIDGRDLPDELLPVDDVPLVDVRLVRDDTGRLIGAEVWDRDGARWSNSRWIVDEAVSDART